MLDRCVFTVAADTCIVSAISRWCRGDAEEIVSSMHGYENNDAAGSGLAHANGYIRQNFSLP